MGLLASLLGNTAITATKLAEEAGAEKAKARESEALLNRQMALADYQAKVQREAELFKASLAERRDQANAKTRMAADAGGDAALQESAFRKFKRDLGQTDATDEQLKQVFDSQYYEQSVAPGDANSDRYNPLESERLLSRRNEALKLGAGAGLLDSYTKEIDGAKKAEKAARDEALRNRKEDRADRQFALQQQQQAALEADRQARLAIDQARLDADTKNRSRIKPVEVLQAVNAAIETNRKLLNDGNLSAEQSDAVKKQIETWIGERDQLMRNVKEPGVSGGGPLAGIGGPMTQADLDAIDREIALVKKSTTVSDEKKAGQLQILESERKKFVERMAGDKKSDPTDTKSLSTPPLDRLKEGKVTTFANGQKWKLVNGKPVQVKD